MKQFFLPPDCLILKAINCYFLLLFFVLEPFQIHAQLEKKNLALYEYTHYDGTNGFPYKSIMDMETDREGVVWLLADGNLIAFRENKFFVQSSISGSDYPLFIRGTSFLKTPGGQLFCQNEKIIVKINGGPIVSYYMDNSLKADLRLYYPRKKCLNFLGSQGKNYWLNRLIVADKFSKSDYLIQNKIIGHYQYGKFSPITPLTDSLIGEFFFGDTVYFVNTNHAIGIHQSKKIGDIQHIYTAKEVVFNLKKVSKIFYIAEKYYAVSKEGLFRIEKQGHTLLAIPIIQSDRFYEYRVNTMLVGKNESWFLFGSDYGLHQYTKNGMRLFSNEDSYVNSMNALLLRNNRIYSNRKGWWDLNGNYHDSTFNPLYSYGFDYVETNSGEIILGHERANHVYNPKLQLLKRLPRESFFCNTVKDEKGRIFQFCKFGIFEWRNDSFVRGNYHIPEPEDLDVIYSGLAYKDTLYLATLAGIYRYKVGSTEPIKNRLLSKFTIRNIQLGPNGEGIYAFTEGGGIYLIRGESIHKVPLDRNNYMSKAHYFILDKLNRLWIPTNSGLLLTDYKSFLQQVLDSSSKIVYHYFKGPTQHIPTEFNGSTKHAAVRDSLNSFLYVSSTFSSPINSFSKVGLAN